MVKDVPTKNVGSALFCENFSSILLNPLKIFVFQMLLKTVFKFFFIHTTTRESRHLSCILAKFEEAQDTEKAADIMINELLNVIIFSILLIYC